MKQILLSIFLAIFFLGSAQAQIVKLKANEVSVKTKDVASGRWSGWSNPQAIDVLILVDGNKNRVKIFSNVEQVYDIIKTYNAFTDRSGTTTNKYDCVDAAGARCELRIVKHSNGVNTLNIDFSDANIIYSIYKLD